MPCRLCTFYSATGGIDSRAQISLFWRSLPTLWCLAGPYLTMPATGPGGIALAAGESSAGYAVCVAGLDAGRLGPRPPSAGAPAPAASADAAASPASAVDEPQPRREDLCHLIFACATL
jgi:hypothetical protein